VIALPDGYTLGTSNRQSVTNARHMLGDSWQVTVYHKGEPAFDMAKELRIDQWSPVYAGRLRGGKWQQYTDIHELVRVMCSKHRIGVGK
jgi:hypothetical protein